MEAALENRVRRMTHGNPLPARTPSSQEQQYSHSGFLRGSSTCLGWRKQKRDDHTLSYDDALANTASEGIEVIVRKRRKLFAGFVPRTGEKRLPQRVMFEELLFG